MARLMRLVLALLALACAAGCVSAPPITVALDAWRQGRRPAALAMAREQVARFVSDNHLAWADIDGSLGEAERLMREETPLLLPDPAQAPSSEPTHGTDALDRGLREDLSATGATRSLRALRVVRRLELTRHAPILFLMVWRRDPWQADGPLLAGASVALRSVAVKVAALRTLEALP